MGKKLSDYSSFWFEKYNFSFQTISGEEVIPTEIIINSCLIEQNNVDLSGEKEKHFHQPSFIASLVEQSKMIDLRTTLSDGLEGCLDISETEKEEQANDDDLEKDDCDLDELENYPDEDVDAVSEESPSPDRCRSRDDEELGVTEMLSQMSGE